MGDDAGMEADTTARCLLADDMRESMPDDVFPQDAPLDEYMPDGSTSCASVRDRDHQRFLPVTLLSPAVMSGDFDTVACAVRLCVSEGSLTSSAVSAALIEAGRYGCGRRIVQLLQQEGARFESPEQAKSVLDGA